MAIWEYRRADEEMQLVDAEVKGLIGQLDKRIDAIAEAIEKHERTLLIQEALAQELPTSSAEQSINQSINITVLTPHLDGNRGHKGEPAQNFFGAARYI